MFNEKKSDPPRMIVARMDITPDHYLHRKIMNLGAYIIHDGPSKVKYGTDAHINNVKAGERRFCKSKKN